MCLDKTGDADQVGKHNAAHKDQAGDTEHRGVDGDPQDVMAEQAQTINIEMAAEKLGDGGDGRADDGCPGR